MQFKSIWEQLKALRPLLFTVYIPTFCALYVLVIVAWYTRIPIAHFTQDPSTVMGAPFYIGLLSNIGILLWCSSASICIFNYAILRKSSHNREFSLFYLFSSIITFYLIFDDLFLFHEVIYREYLHIPEKAVLSAYGIMMFAYILRFIKVILLTEYLIFLLSFVFFGLSIIIDLKFPGNHMFEDTFKLLGIISWLIYFSKVSTQQLKRAMLFQQTNSNEQKEVSTGCKGNAKKPTAAPS